MIQEVTNLLPGGQPLSQSLGFEARSVVVDNYTTSYVDLPDAGRTIAPWATGRVVALPPGIRRARADLKAISPAPAGPPVPLSQCTLTWSDQALPEAPGHLLQQSAYSQVTQIGTVTALGGGGQVSKTIDVPAGALVIGLLIDFSQSGNPTGLTIAGHQTGDTYLNITSASVLAGNPGPYTAIIGSPVDTSIDVRVTPSGSTAVVDVLAYAAQVNVFAQQVPGTALNVQQLSGASLAVTLASASPAPWQAPSSVSTVLDGSTIANGATNTIIAAVPGQTVRVFDVDLRLDAAGNFILDDTGGTRVAAARAGGAGPALGPINWGGRPLALGMGLRINNNSGAAITVFGQVGFTQA